MEQGNLLNRINESQQAAFYNTLFLGLLGICLGALYLVYQMFSMFITPIILGSLFGTVLFPMKRTFSVKMNDWLNKLDEANQPLLLGLVLMPFHSLNQISTAIFQGAASKHGVYCFVTYALLKILGYDANLVKVFSFLGRLYGYADIILEHLTQLWILPLIAFYSVAYSAWIFIQSEEELRSHKKVARTMSLPIWVFLLAFTFSYCGVFHVLFFVLTAILLGLISLGLIPFNIKNDVTNDNLIEPTDEAGTSQQAGESNAQVVPEIMNIEQALTGDCILQMIFTLFVLLCISKHDLLMVVVVILFSYGFVVSTAEQFELWNTLTIFAQNNLAIREHAYRLVKITTPGFLRQFFYVLFTGDKYLIGLVKRNVDMLSSMFVMLGLSIGTLLFFIFTVFQLHSECLHVGALATNVISQGWFNNAMNYTGQKLDEQSVNGYAEQAYQSTREWSCQYARSLVNPPDKVRADELCEKFKLIIDFFYNKVYKELLMPSLNNSTAVASRGSLLAQLSATTDLEALKKELILIVKENLQTIIDVAQSIWRILAVNISILSTFAFSIIRIIFVFGFDLINFFFEVVCFLIVAFNLTVYSSEQFLLYHWLSKIAPSIQPRNTNVRFVPAIEDAISSVYVLTAKMGTFYFLNTFFICSLFNLNIVFIPSLLCAILALLPVLPTYSVAIFGIIELYFAHDKLAAAVLFFVANFVPTLFVDSTFYQEIKNCHSYLIGLAIVGGIYAFGAKGGLIGPIILCCLIVLFNLLAKFIKNR